VILDGSLIATDRLPGAKDRLRYSGKHHCYGMNIQSLTDPHGELIWASPALPGSTHDLAAARIHGIIDGPPTGRSPAAPTGLLRSGRDRHPRTNAATATS
jgi:hypothetical protein